MAREELTKCRNNMFECDLSPHITRISPITATFSPDESVDGRHAKYKVFQPGTAQYGNITFEGAEHKDSIGNIKSWVKDAYDGKEARKNITVSVFDQAGNTARSFNLIDCFPLHFTILDVESGRASTVRWSLEVRVSYWKTA